MSSRVRIQLEPLGKTLEVAPGTPLQDVLFPYGVEFPCGGRGRCKRCRVKVTEGSLPVTAGDEGILTPREIAEGWRLACHARVEAGLTLEIAQWETAILADDSAFAFTPREGLGIAIDLGTTTLVAQLLDLRTARVMGVRTALNPQVKHGSDLMTRVEFAIRGGQRELEHMIRTEVGTLIRKLAPPGAVRDVVLVGNTVMHHLFCGVDVEPLSHCPFEPSGDGQIEFRATELGWTVPGDPAVRFLGCLGGFVGSDILAGVLATRMHENERLTALLDLGTNGEIVAGNRERLVCASTAAGPAFEGGRIGMGMRAATGAIMEVRAEDGRMHCRVLGHVAARGICGSGLVDAAAAALDLGLVLPGGRLALGAKTIPLAGDVALTQSDIRELQLAKGATSAGLDIVLGRLGATVADLDRVYLAGAFGNYLNRASAARIGLLNLPIEAVEPAGNTALLGAKLSLFQGADYADLRARVEHVSLGTDPEFQERYVEAMAFPA
ncbi:MAG TPA: ASKHA domain-containing protein [Bryobacteraceae bacterium]|nr:ASKHA domain-containing protein [Bryobacteraceae bacterium]